MINPLIWYIILALWVTYLPYGCSFVYHYLKYRRAFINTRASIEDVREFERRGKELWFQITTRTLLSGFAHFSKAIHAIEEACKEANFSRYKIVVVADKEEGDEAIKEHLEKKGIIVVLCPSDYRTNAIRKARALQYAVEHFYKRLGAHENRWILHLDEESLICPQTLFSVCQFANSGKLLGEGPIFYPPELSRNPFSVVLDSVRASTCYFCVGTMTSGRPPNHLHGSNLLVRMDVECEVGWAHGPSVAEDQLFGARAFERYPKFGWHGGVIFESSPATLSSFLKQRKRWVVGTLQNFRRLPSSVCKNITYRFTVWYCGFLSAVVSLPLWLLSFAYLFYLIMGYSGIPYVPHGILDTPFVTINELIVDAFQGDVFKWLQVDKALPLTLGLLAGTSFITWVLGYVIGLYHNNSFTIPAIYSVSGESIKKLKCFILFIITIWFVGLFENYPMFKGLIEYRRGKVEWDVTRK
jgi:egghead protein (zeste-white 4 protein)